MKWFKRALTPWRILPEPRIVSGLMVGIYCVSVLIGTAWYLDPQDAVISRDIGIAGGYATATLWIVGGLCGLLALRAGWWWLERGGLWFVIAGLLGRLLIVKGITIEWGELIVREGIIVIAIAGLVIRLVRIMGLATDPTKGR